MRQSLADILYHPEYLKYLKEFQLTSSFVCGELSRSNIKKVSAEGLFYIFNRCDPKMAQKLASQELMVLKFGLDELLFTKGVFEKRLEDVADLFDLSDWDLAPLLFYTAPSFFFLPKEEVLLYAEKYFRLSDKTCSYYQYNQRLKKAFDGSDEKRTFRNPMEFVAAVTTYYREEQQQLALVDKEDKRIVEEMVESLKTADLYRLNESQIDWLKELYDSFTGIQKESFRETASKRHVHPYLRRLVTGDKRKGVVIDGSNVMLTGLLKPDPRRFQQLLNVMGAHIPLLYPFLILFDANADHLVRTERAYWEKHFIKNPLVIFHSPADELILKIAYEKRYTVISNDRFRDYGPLSVEVLRFQPEKGKLFFQ